MHHESTVADTLVHLRTQRGLTLSGLSQHCGLARRLLQQIEAGEATPTLETLRSLACALNTPLGLFFQPRNVDGSSARFLSADKGTAIRLLESSTGRCREEIYSFDIQGGHSKRLVPHLPGIIGSIRVTAGSLEVRYPRHTTAVHAGDTHTLAIDVEHCLATQTHPVRGLLTLSYPAHDQVLDIATHRLDWPTSPLAWEGVHSLIERMLIDVCNGIGAALLRFRVNTWHGVANMIRENRNDPSAQHFLTALEANVPAHASARHWPGHTWTGVDAAGPYIVVLPMLTSCAFTGDGADRVLCADTVLLARAERFARYAETPHTALPDHVQLQLTRARGKDDWTLATLACEVELQRGTAFAPTRLHRHTPLVTSDGANSGAVNAGGDGDADVPACSGNDDGDFSNRIDVRSYDAFELLHPAYARQAVAMAQDILTYGAPTSCCRSIDVGTGPGVPLLMLMELLPALRTLAVEPDDLAFSCLQKNTLHAEGIDLHHGDFLTLDHPPEQVRLMTSTGASHHFHTAQMFQKASTLLASGGVFCIADEFLPEFRTDETRKRALIQHHAAYIANTLAWIDSGANAPMSDEEVRHYAAFSQTIPLALIDLHLGHTEQAVQRCRRLYCSLRQSTALHAPAQHAIGMYIRLFWLELQAMVAGLDYEVECKTHARRFVDMARSAGLNLLRHRRLYATTGSDEWSGGTHLFTFSKPFTR